MVLGAYLVGAGLWFSRTDDEDLRRGTTSSRTAGSWGVAPSRGSTWSGTSAYRSSAYRGRPTQCVRRRASGEGDECLER